MANLRQILTDSFFFRSKVILFLPIFNEPKTQLLLSINGATLLIISPPGGSIFNTFAPRSANSLVQKAPEIIPVKSKMNKSDKLVLGLFDIFLFPKPYFAELPPSMG